MTETNERWLPIYINGQLTNYEVSDQGRVRNSKLHIKSQIVNLGYCQVLLSFGNPRKQRFKRVAALVANAFIGPRPKGLQIDHINGVKSDNRAENLEYVTQSENIRRSFAHGNRRRTAGSRFLSKGTYERIIKAWETGKYSQIQLGRVFGLYNSTISKIVRGVIRARDNGHLELYPDWERLEG